MYSYILLVIKYYPYFYYLMTLYDFFGYLNFMRKMYAYIYNKLKPEINKEIDEIYELISQTEPGKVDVITQNDTNYVKYNEKTKTIYDKWYNYNPSSPLLDDIEMEYKDCEEGMITNV